MISRSYVARNRAHWNQLAAEYAQRAAASWKGEPAWGIWRIAETEVGLLEGVEGEVVLEDGCGTGYVSAWMAKRGASVVGLDNSPAQLATARHVQEELGLQFPLVHGIGERLPFADRSFDRVISEYGAAIWADPYEWIPEAARVLRPGGELSFLCNSTLLTLCMPDLDEDLPAGAELVRDFFGLHRIDWPDEDSTEFHLGHGDWIRLFRANDLEVIDLVELRAPEGASSHYDFVTPEWARRWPSEEIWRVRKR